MRRICIVRQGYFPGDVRVRKEALALASHGYEVDVICLKEKGEKGMEVHQGINVYRIPIWRERKDVGSYARQYGMFFCLATILICALHFKKRYGFVQVNTMPDFLVFCTLLPKLCGAKVTLDLHEPTPELFATIFGEERKTLLRLVRLAEKLSIRYADRAITVSDEMKENYVRRGSPRSKIDVVLNVPNLEFDRRLCEGELERSDKKLMIVCHGTMLERYGQDTALKAVKIAKEKIPEIELNILGSGHYEGILKKLASELNLGEHARFLGFIPFLDVVKMVGRCDMGIVPVRKNAYSDLVHTNKMFELISMKRPVIISRTKAVENFFGSDGVCLKYFESGNEEDLARCIVELGQNPEKGRQMAENAYARFEAVRWERVQEEYCSIYDKLGH